MQKNNETLLWTLDPWKLLFRNKFLWKDSVVWGYFFEVLLSNFEGVWKYEKRLLAESCFIFCLCVCLSVCLSSNLPFRKVLWLLLDGFSWHLIFEYSSKKCRENARFIKMDKITGTGHDDQYTRTGRDDQYTRIIITRSVILRTRDV